MKTNYRNAWWLALVMLACGYLSGLPSMDGVARWYSTLQKTPGTPPGWVFGPVWSILYILIGCLLAYLWNRGKRAALAVLLVNIALNLIWSTVFFRWQSPGWAFGILIVMLVTLAWSWVLAGRVGKLALAGYVLYMGWLMYATWLSGGLWWLN